MSMLDMRAGDPSSTPATHLPALPTGWHALHHAALADGCLAVLAADVDIAAEFKRIFAADGRANPPSRVSAMADAGAARLLVLRDGGWWNGPRFPLETPFPLVDRFADGRWLVTASRTNGSPNARLLSPDGTLLARLMLGNGIEHATIDGTGQIWVGWFDEGIYGNDGWRVPGEQWPPSSRGIGCFHHAGTLLSLPDFPDAAGLIADCYALTPVDGGA